MLGVSLPRIAIATQPIGAAGVDADQHDVPDPRDGRKTAPRGLSGARGIARRFRSMPAAAGDDGRASAASTTSLRFGPRTINSFTRFMISMLRLPKTRNKVQVERYPLRVPSVKAFRDQRLEPQWRPNRQRVCIRLHTVARLKRTPTNRTKCTQRRAGGRFFSSIMGGFVGCKRPAAPAARVHTNEFFDVTIVCIKIGSLHAATKKIKRAEISDTHCWGSRCAACAR